MSKRIAVGVWIGVIALLWPMHALPAGNILIVQVYPGGGNSGATYTHDYVVLFNTTEAALPLTGYSLQYWSGTGLGVATAAATYAFERTATIPARGYYLLALGSGISGQPLPLTPDAQANIALGATAGKLALWSTTERQEPPTAVNTVGLVDYLYYGSGTTPVIDGLVPAPTNATQCMARKFDGQVQSYATTGNLTSDCERISVAGMPRNTRSEPLPPVWMVPPTLQAQVPVANIEQQAAVLEVHTNRAAMLYAMCTSQPRPDITPGLLAALGQQHSLEPDALARIALDGLSHSTTYHLYLVAKGDGGYSQVIHVEFATLAAPYPRVSLSAPSLSMQALVGQPVQAQLQVQCDDIDGWVTLDIVQQGTQFGLSTTSLDGAAGVPHTLYIQYQAGQSEVALLRLTTPDTVLAEVPLYGIVMEATANMLYNAGFEDWTAGGKTLPYWQHSTVSGAVSPDSTPEMVPQGRYSLKTVNRTTTTNRDLVQQVAGIQAGQEYVLSFWYYLDKASTGGGLQVSAIFAQNDRELKEGQWQHTYNTKGQWQQVQHYPGLIAPQGANSLKLLWRTLPATTSYMDSVVLALLPADAPRIIPAADSVVWDFAMAGHAVPQHIAVAVRNISEPIPLAIEGPDAQHFYSPSHLYPSDTTTLTVHHAPLSPGQHRAMLRVGQGAALRTIPLIGYAADSSVVVPTAQWCTNQATSPLQGQQVVAAGVVTAVHQPHFFMQQGMGAGSAVYVFCPHGHIALAVGDSVVVQGIVQEYAGLTQLTVYQPTHIVQVGRAQHMPQPLPIHAADYTKAYHASLLRLDSVLVVEQVEPGVYMGLQGTQPVWIHPTLCALPLTVGSLIQLQCVGYYGHGAQYWPRSAADVVLLAYRGVRMSGVYIDGYQAIPDKDNQRFTAYLPVDSLGMHRVEFDLWGGESDFVSGGMHDFAQGDLVVQARYQGLYGSFVIRAVRLQPTMVHTPGSEGQVVLYPNPTNERVYIQTRQPVQHYRLYNLAGQLIQQGPCTTYVNLYGLPPGVYMVHLQWLYGGGTTAYVTKE